MEPKSIDRREFLVTSGAWAASMPFVASKARPRLAFHVYGVRNLCDKDVLGTLKAAREIGYEGVVTGRLYGWNAETWRSMCNDSGLELVAYQIYPFCLTVSDLSRMIDFCKTSGCHRLSTAWYKGSAENLGDWQLVVNVLNHAAEVCEREGITVAYHNHDQEFNTHFDGRTIWEWLWEGEGRNEELNQFFPESRFAPSVMQDFDPSWCTLAGDDAVQWFVRHSSRIKTIHVSLENEACDWPKIVRMAQSSGTEWFVVKSARRSVELDVLRSNFEYLKGLIA